MTKPGRVLDFCGERLTEDSAPCVRPKNHYGLHVPVTHEDAPRYVEEWRRWPTEDDNPATSQSRAM